MAAPPPVHAAVGVQQGSKRRKSLGDLFAWASVKGCQHALKLRHSFRVDPQTRLEIGMDWSLEQHDLQRCLQTAAPWAAVHYQLDAEDAGKGCIELNPHWVAYQSSIRLGKEGAWWEVPLDAKLGVTFTGQPHVEVGIGNVPLVLTLAAVMLAAGKPLSVKRKEVGGLALHFPVTLNGTKHDHTLQERVEIDATLRRQGMGLKLDFHQINGILRLKQD